MGKVVIVYRNGQPFEQHRTADVTCADVPDWRDDERVSNPDNLPKWVGHKPQTVPMFYTPREADNE